MKINILLTSVGRRSYLVKYFKEALCGRGTIHVANSEAKSPAFLVADKAVITPLIYDDEYIPFLLQYCEENNISAIIPLFDVDLPVLSRNKNLFQRKGIKIVVSDPRVIDICNDKWNSYCYLKEQGFNVPATYINLDDAINAIQSGRIRFPVIIKPRWGMGSIGVFEAESISEVRAFYQCTYRRIVNSYLKYESEIDIENSILIQEKIEGQEYGLDVINDFLGNNITTIVKQKYAMRAGETDCAIVVQNPELKEIGKRLGDALQHIANLDVDVFRTDSGKIMILEMNARFGGGYPFSHIAGVNLPRAIISWLLGEDVNQNDFMENYDIVGQKDISIVRLPNI